MGYKAVTVSEENYLKNCSNETAIEEMEGYCGMLDERMGIKGSVKNKEQGIIWVIKLQVRH